MSHIDGVMEFKLRKSVRYSIGGQFEEATFLQLNEPSGSHNKNMRRLSAMVNAAMLLAGDKFKAMHEANDGVTQLTKSMDETPEEEHKTDSNEASQALSFAFAVNGDADKQEDFIEEFHKIIVKQSDKPLCLLEGHDQAPFRETHWELMDYQDQIDVALGYAAFFGIGYLGDMMEKSDKP